jgi:hypothetical protein
MEVTNTHERIYHPFHDPWSMAIMLIRISAILIFGHIQEIADLCQLGGHEPAPGLL